MLLKWIKSQAREEAKEKKIVYGHEQNTNQNVYPNPLRNQKKKLKQELFSHMYVNVCNYQVRSTFNKIGNIHRRPTHKSRSLVNCFAIETFFFLSQWISVSCCDFFYMEMLSIRTIKVEINEREGRERKKSLSSAVYESKH